MLGICIGTTYPQIPNRHGEICTLLLAFNLLRAPAVNLLLGNSLIKVSRVQRPVAKNGSF